MNSIYLHPILIDFEHKPNTSGNITFFENDQLKSFLVKRVFWISDVTEGGTRGVHAHKKENQVLVCLKGKVKVILESKKGQQFEFQLDKESQGLVVPNMHWQKINFTQKSILLVFADCEFSEEDYIRDKNIFDEFRGQY